MSTKILNALNKIGHNISSTPLKNISPHFTRCYFIIVNDYALTRHDLKEDPLNDALTVAQYARSCGISTYFIYNSTLRDFLSKFELFLKRTSGFLFVFYVGHGIQVDDYNGDESDGLDEGFLFQNKGFWRLFFSTDFIVDDDLATFLKKHKNPSSSLVLISDACHCGTVWDLTTNPSIPKRIISLSSTHDTQKANQQMIDGRQQGFFTCNFFKLLKSDSSSTPQQLKSKIDPILNKNGQALTIETTSPEMLNEKIFHSEVQSRDVFINDFKVAILGEHNVGKTAIINRFCKNKFDLNTPPTLSSHITTHTIEVDHQEVKLSIYDTAGTEKYHSLIPTYLKGCHGLIMVYDIFAENPVQELDHFLKIAKDTVSEKIPILLFGNKIDLNPLYEETDDISRWVHKNNIDLSFLCSALTGEGIQEGFLELATTIEDSLKAPFESSVLLSSNIHRSTKKDCCI